ncbi:hypothetical protein MKW94_014422 [Papaver nudicaule]|uniref:Uncharacterized protein n=1 Tax=Papaver nudicaule TaxID=74823 RepID=A0AA41VZW1_PAPNU|nr:hypothetical protein [Papaver nudicaule]
MGRNPCCSKEGLNRGAWTATEDKILSDYIKKHGEGGWRNLPIKAGLRRCGKSCRLRWLNYLRPDIKRGNISSDEEELIIRLHKLLGNRWSLIAGRLPGRTDNEIKNYWNTNLAKKIQDNSTSSSSRKSSIKSKEKKKRPVTGTSVETRTSKPKAKSSTVVKTKALRCTKLFFAATTPQPQIVENQDKIRVSNDHYKEMDLVSGNGFSGYPLRGKNLLQNCEMDFNDGENCCFPDVSKICSFGGEKMDDFSSPSSDESLLFLDEMLHNWTGNDCIRHDVPSDIQPLVHILGSEGDWLK